MNGTLHPEDDRWLDLVNGLLAAPARRELLDHARDCAACAERLREIAAAHERTLARAAERFGAEAAGLALAPAPKFAGSAVAPPARRPVRSWAQGLAVAAAVVVVAGGMWIASRPPALTVPPTPLPRPDTGILTRSNDGTPGGEDVADGLAAYARGDYAEARHRLERAKVTGPLAQVRWLYLGSSRLQLGDARGARRAFEAVDPQLVPEPWVGEWQWGLATALANCGEEARADSLRRVVAGRPDALGERARRGWSSGRETP